MPMTMLFVVAVCLRKLSIACNFDTFRSVKCAILLHLHFAADVINDDDASYRRKAVRVRVRVWVREGRQGTQCRQCRQGRQFCN